MFMEPASCNTMKLRKYQCFCWAMARKHCKYSDFCYQRQKIIVNTVAWGFRGAKNIGVYGVVCSESLKKAWKHHLFDDFRPLRDWEKKLQGQQQQQQPPPTTNDQQTTNNQQPTRRRRRSTKMWQKMCGKRVTSWDMKVYHTVLCTCAHAQSTRTTPTLTLLYITLMASPVREAL